MTAACAARLGFSRYNPTHGNGHGDDAAVSFASSRFRCKWAKAPPTVAGKAAELVACARLRRGCSASPWRLQIALSRISWPSNNLLFSDACMAVRCAILLPEEICRDADQHPDGTNFKTNGSAGGSPRATDADRRAVLHTEDGERRPMAPLPALRSWRSGDQECRSEVVTVSSNT